MDGLDQRHHRDQSAFGWAGRTASNFPHGSQDALMPNKLIIFPETKQAEAEAYKDAINVHYAATYEPGDIWAYIRNDAFGQWVVPFYGPPWYFMTPNDFTEPPELEAFRVDGVIYDFAVWPED
jgi:hypothetical protein